MDVKGAYDFFERWLSRAHLYGWLIGDAAVSSILGWWANIRGWDFIVVVLAAVGAFVVILLLIVFIYCLIAQHHRSSRAAIQIILGQDAPFHTYKQRLHYREHLIKIGIRNPFQDKALSNCDVSLVNISGMLGDRCPVSIKSHFILNPGATEYIEFVELRETRSGPPLSAPGAGIRAYFPINPLPSDKSSWLDDPPYSITLMATAAESPPCRIECRLLLDDGVLKLEPKQPA